VGWWSYEQDLCIDKENIVKIRFCLSAQCATKRGMISKIITAIRTMYVIITALDIIV